MTHKWLPLTEAQAWDELTELWVSGKSWGEIDLAFVLKGKTAEDFVEIFTYARNKDFDAINNVLEAFCDEFLSKNPKVIKAYIQEKNDENAEDDSYLDDPRRGQARYLVEAI